MAHIRINGTRCRMFGMAYSDNGVIHVWFAIRQAEADRIMSRWDKRRDDDILEWPLGPPLSGTVDQFGGAQPCDLCLLRQNMPADHTLGVFRQVRRRKRLAMYQHLVATDPIKAARFLSRYRAAIIAERRIAEILSREIEQRRPLLDQRREER